ncbi:class I SAM-dependent methyltransferase [Nostoc sp.]|uniref:class I SAM-dependent methyltransferase n=1 Tax=Nostoc sp. TaxID=1180 RepID=UPI002FF9C6B2
MTTQTRKFDEQLMLSHKHTNEALEKAIENIKDKIRQLGNKAHASVEQQLEIVDQLTEFPLGVFLLQNRGTDGYWTDYMIEHQYRGRITGADLQGRLLTEFEKIFLDKFPLVIATQQRALNFKTIIQKHIKEGAVLASLPCGLMRDLLSLDFTNIENFRLVGIDIDSRSLDSARKLAETYGLTKHVEFSQENAWNQPFENSFTLLASNGLTVYEPDEDRVIELYRQFFKALVPNGILVTSCITPSPDVDPNSEWDMNCVDQDGLLKQKILYTDILNFDFRGLKSSTITETQLKSVGFVDIEITWDDARLFPTLVARKPE